VVVVVGLLVQMVLVQTVVMVPMDFFMEVEEEEEDLVLLHRIHLLKTVVLGEVVQMVLLL
jgi:beta-lactamase regulating signal transducer with metallopeptidase domain